MNVKKNNNKIKKPSEVANDKFKGKWGKKMSRFVHENKEPLLGNVGAFDSKLYNNYIIYQRFPFASTKRSWVGQLSTTLGLG